MREGIRYIEPFERTCHDAIARPKAHTGRLVYLVLEFDGRKVAFVVRSRNSQVFGSGSTSSGYTNISLIAGVAAMLHVALRFPLKSYGSA